MPFFNIQEDQDTKRAKKLAKILTYSNLLTTKPSIKGWTKSFRLLRQKDEIEEDRIDKVLKWYKSNINEQYIPIVHSAKGFRKLFAKLEAAKNRTATTNVTENTPDGDFCMKYMSCLLWPERPQYPDTKNTGSQLRQFIETSLANYGRYIDVLMGICTPQLFKQSHYLYYTLEIIRDTQVQPTEIIMIWTREIHRIAWNWDKWKGDLMRWVWTLDKKLYQERMRDTIGRMTGCDCWPEASEYLLRRL